MMSESLVRIGAYLSLATFTCLFGGCKSTEGKSDIKTEYPSDGFPVGDPDRYYLQRCRDTPQNFKGFEAVLCSILKAQEFTIKATENTKYKFATNDRKQLREAFIAEVTLRIPEVAPHLQTVAAICNIPADKITTKHIVGVALADLAYDSKELNEKSLVQSDKSKLVLKTRLNGVVSLKQIEQAWPTGNLSEPYQVFYWTVSGSRDLSKEGTCPSASRENALLRASAAVLGCSNGIQAKVQEIDPSYDESCYLAKTSHFMWTLGEKAEMVLNIVK